MASQSRPSHRKVAGFFLFGITITIKTIMSETLKQFISAGRQAMIQKDWALLEQIVAQMVPTFPDSAESHYLRGVLARVKRDVPEAIEAFKQGLSLDDQRYDMAVELANMYSVSRQNAAAAELLDHYSSALNDSPRYADLAGTIYTEIGMSDRALPLFKRACELQPEAQVFKANLATCAVFVGDIDLGETLYRELLAANPEHRKNHYQLSRLKKAKDETHIKQMLSVIKDSSETARNIPVYFALGKEYEDLGEWDKSFEFYQKACDGVKAQTGHDVQQDIAQIETIKEAFNADYMSAMQSQNDPKGSAATPIFVLGLPRSGTTLVERILSSHPDVTSLGETVFLQLAIRNHAGLQGSDKIDAKSLQRIAKLSPEPIASEYLNSVAYRLKGESFFIEKLPFNFLYAGLIAAAWPNARIVNLVRHPMDSCFSMYKQVFTWAYKYSYWLDDLGQYYVAYDSLREHWKQLLGDRFVEVRYEELVSDQEAQTRTLLDALKIPFDQACLEFEKNAAPSATASSVQVRSKVHSGSVGKWQHYAKHLKPLEDHLRAGGVDLEAHLQ